MKILSFNSKGLENNLKKLALKKLLSLQHPDIIFLQETMGMEEEISLHMKKYFTFYDFHAITARGHSGGLTLGWDPREVKLLNI